MTNRVSRPLVAAYSSAGAYPGYPYWTGRDATFSRTGTSNSYNTSRTIVNNMTAVSRLYDFGISVLTVNAVGQPPKSYNGNVMSVSGFSIPEPDSSLRNEVDSKLVQRLRQTDSNYAAAFAEGAQTIDMIAGRARQIAQIAFSVKKLDPKGIWAALGVGKDKNRYHGPSKRQERYVESLIGLPGNPKDLKKVGIRPDDLWLEMQYGWKPLCSDIYNAAIDHYNAVNAKEDRFSARAMRETAVTRPNVLVGPGNFVNARFRYHYQTQLQKIAYTKIDDAIYKTATGISDPLSVAWEVLPASFIVDWFYPVGTFLEDMHTVEAYKATTTVCQTVRYIGDVKLASYTVPSNMALSNPGGSTYYEKRVIRSSVPLTVPQPKVAKPGLSISHATSAIALISSAFGRK